MVHIMISHIDSIKSIRTSSLNDYILIFNEILNAKVSNPQKKMGSLQIDETKAGFCIEISVCSIL